MLASRLETTFQEGRLPSARTRPLRDPMPFPTVAEDLARRGWAVHRIEGGEDAVLAASEAIARELGVRSPGRGGALLETIVPTALDRAHARSLSSRHGLDSLPLAAEVFADPAGCAAGGS